MKQAKPILHGRDHGPGGSDGIPSTGVTDGSPLVADATTGYVKWGTATGGSGIQFDTAPQVGNWLDIETTGSDPDHGRGIWMKTDSGGGGIRIFNEGTGSVSLETYGAGDLNIFSDVSDINVGANDGGFLVDAQGDSGIQLSASGDGDILIQHFNSGGNILLAVNGGNITLDTSGGAGFLRIFGLPTSNPGGFGRVWSDGGVLTIT